MRTAEACDLLCALLVVVGSGACVFLIFRSSRDQLKLRTEDTLSSLPFVRRRSGLSLPLRLPYTQKTLRVLVPACRLLLLLLLDKMVPVDLSLLQSRAYLVCFCAKPVPAYLPLFTWPPSLSSSSRRGWPARIS